MQDLYLTAARGVGVYILMLVVIRLLGKRSVGAFSAFDLLVALMLGEVVDEIIYGDVSFIKGSAAILVIALLHFLTGWTAYASKSLDRILEGSPTVIIRDGELDRKGLAKERINEEDVYSFLRIQCIGDMREVKVAAVEPSGQISIVRHEWAEPVQRGDLPGEESDARRRAIGACTEPPRAKDTLSSEALGEAV